jgi:hypothetical protein
MTPRAKVALCAEIEAHVLKRKDAEGLHEALRLCDCLDGAQAEFGANDCAILRARAALGAYWSRPYE